MQRCLKCNYEWEEKPEGHIPKKCPKCQRYDWFKPRVWVKNKQQEPAPINIVQQTSQEVW